MSGSGGSDPWKILHDLPMGQTVEIHREDGRSWRGTLVPSHEFSGDRVVQLKLASGYNVGLHVLPDDRVVVVPTGRPDESGFTPPVAEPEAPSAGRWVAVLTTGGTIASRVDYRTGGVKPVRDEREILGFYPDLLEQGPVRILPVFDKLSEEVDPEDWMVLGQKVSQTLLDGARGVVIAHGTDTLGYSAAALSFLLDGLTGPVVLVGAQRSPDRPSSDGFSNLAAAVRIARETDLGEVVVVMHAGLSDDRFAIHRGSRVRKMHSSRRDAFRSRNGPPLGYLDPAGLHWVQPYRRAGHGPTVLAGKLGGPAGLLWFHPGLSPDRAAAFVAGLRGAVLAGTGLGHTSTAHLGWIRAAVKRGVVLAMTTQCLEGEVDPYVYATGRELLRAGVVYARDLLPETAYVKLLWALGQSDDPTEVGRLLLADRAGEFEPRHPAQELP